MEHSSQERMREIEIFGIPALFSPNRIKESDVYPGLHHYEIMSGPVFPDSPRHLTADAGEKFLGPGHGYENPGQLPPPAGG